MRSFATGEVRHDRLEQPSVCGSYLPALLSTDRYAESPSAVRPRDDLARHLGRSVPARRSTGLPGDHSVCRATTGAAPCPVSPLRAVSCLLVRPTKHG